VAESARCQKSTAQGFAATGSKALFFLTWALSLRGGNDLLQFCVTTVTQNCKGHEARLGAFSRVSV